MIPIFTIIKRLRRLPRHHRIAHLRALIPGMSARSIRRRELEYILRDEIMAQLKAENRGAA